VLLLEVVGDLQFWYSEGRTSCSYPTDSNLRNIYLDSVVYPYCMVMWLYLPNIEPEDHAVCMHIAWFLRYSTLESGQVYI